MRQIIVPISLEAMQAIDYGAEESDLWIGFNVDDSTVNDLEYSGAIDDLNKSTGALIDHFESAVIECEKLHSAKQVIDNMLKDNSQLSRHATLSKVQLLLDEGIKRKTCIIFEL